ncbi:MAG TPA: hypothetical protein VKT82_10570 [Ktedonobacterales bacterium]|nr:hypothetical protein [Ktedonobacterales bacterium]
MKQEVSTQKRHTWRNLLGVLLALLIVGGLGVWIGSHAMPAQAATPQTNISIIGSWLVQAKGAPFAQHVMVFSSDHTFLIDNPEAGDTHTSDSLGAGAWKLDPQHADRVLGVFEEINADRSTGHYTSQLTVTFQLFMQGANAFSGPAEATYYNPDGTKQNDQPYPATLTGVRIQP